MSTAGHIPVQLNCHCIFEHAASNVTWLVALIETFALGSIYQSAGMVLVDERHQPPMQPLHDGSYHDIHLFAVRIIYFFSVSLIQGAVHLLPLWLQQDSTSLYFRNMIDSNSFNLFYI